NEGTMLLEAAGRVFADLTDESALFTGEWPAHAWAAVEDMGLPLALVPEEAGGFGVATLDALALVRLSGFHALPLPLAETMVANRLLGEAGLPLAEGPAGFARSQGERVPWGRYLAVLAVADADGRIARVGRPAISREGTNLAGQPRDGLETGTDGAPSAPRKGHDPLLWGAAIRALQMAGALERVLQLTVAHVSERQQFGRPLSKFQAVQHELAKLGSEVAAASAAADMAAEAIAGDSDARLAIAAARVRAGEAVGVATSIAQQLHGAIGFTREHVLHRFTTALWSWRDEYGGHGYWSQMLGTAALAAGGAGFWAFVTEAA
ncbi:MAG: acyl-CoA/acyl-ACP dehydrogenase, partial [Novosphingobium sp.]|nr:acyl-CoA/acyl-ACP dehydrogenase [Novosphingobium sp.]